MFIDDLISRLVAAGLGTPGVSIFKGSRSVVPEGSGPFITLIATGGLGDEGTHNDSRDGIAYERPSAQVVVRAQDYEVAEARVALVYSNLNFVDTTINGVWWRRCAPKQEPFDLGVDQKGLVRLVFNIETVKRVS